MSVSGIEALTGAFQQAMPPQIDGADIGGTQIGAAQIGAVQSPQGPAGIDFGGLLTQSIDGLESMGDRRDGLAVQAATGDLGAIQDYTIAASEFDVATQLTVSVRNKAMEAFSEVMRMQV